MSKQPKAFDKAIAECIQLFEKKHISDHTKNPAFKQFIRKLYQNMSLDEFQELDPVMVIARAASLFDFMQQRAPKKTKIRTVNSGDLMIDASDKEDHFTLLEIVNDDMPFIVDSVTSLLNLGQFTIKDFLHPVIRLHRDFEGRILCHQGLENQEAGDAESLIQIKLPFIKGKKDVKKLIDDLERVLMCVRQATSDWKNMLRQNDRAIQGLCLLENNPDYAQNPILGESIDFLGWLEKDHFTFLGMREYTLEAQTGKNKMMRMQVVDGSGLGVLANDKDNIFQGFRKMKILPPDVQHFIDQTDLVLISKANRKSDVHRHVHMDVIFIKKMDPKTLKVTGLYLITGLFTSTAYHTSPIRIPLIQRKIQTTLRYAGYQPTSHDGKALLNILETYPRTELFQIQENELAEISLGILQLQERQRTALFVRHDPFERFISCLVYVPREKYHTKLRQTIQTILESHMHGEVTAFYPQLPEDSSLARVHFILKTEKGNIPHYHVRRIENEIQEAAKDWTDHLREALVEKHGYKKGQAVYAEYEHVFPISYWDYHTAKPALTDIDYLDALHAQKDCKFIVNLYEKKHGEQSFFHLKIYHRHAPIPLSSILPVIENMGFSVYNEIPFKLHYKDGSIVWIHDFGLRSNTACLQGFKDFKPLFEDSFVQIWLQNSENDSFNRLVPAVGIDWRQVIIFRAYYQYAKQIKGTFSKGFVSGCLSKQAALTQLLYDLFIAKFDPKITDKERNKRVKKLQKQIDKALHDVELINEDKVLRGYKNLIDATTRTNFFQKDKKGKDKEYISFKINSQDVLGMPLPTPYREIFVYSARMEAIHLRGGKVARGGIRWSDRPEDYRSEVLDLMKAQMVKNVVIVPVGSKGGFITKALPKNGDRQAIQEEVIRCYQTMMRGMLDITDNRVGRKIMHPKDTVIHDAPDPYLVVAADKGTASFSDIANTISESYGFWLGDAFASGGSAGYDHKKMAITARGAWESVKRHFREMERDTQSEDFTVIGVGDMSGDVFGNGMLLSKHIRLQAAFNHLHIFIDPDPDAKKTFIERERLFKLSRSSWSDYNEKLLSKGGRIYDRNSKTCTLTPEIQQFLGTRTKELAPNDLIRHILRAKADLLWFGGIGTYIKATYQNDIEVGDRTNDTVRVKASEISVKVIGEGANLGITQKGRIQLSLAGVRLNTDAIDNSGGVNSSDFEVNIKILLNSLMAAKKLSRTERDKILEAMTDDVAQLTLRQNYLQNQAISYVHKQNFEYIDRLERFINRLEKDGLLNRTLEHLPTTKTIQERRMDKRGFTRPELSVVLSYAKMNIYNHLLASDLPDNDFFEDRLLSYFPKLLVEKFADEIPNHRLKREIVATCITNQSVDRLGPAYMMEISNRTGHDLVNVVRAFELTRAIFNLDNFWQDIEKLDGTVSTKTQYDMLHEVGRLTERVIMWLLKNENDLSNMKKIIAKYKNGVQSIIAKIDCYLSKKRKDFFMRQAKKLQKNNVPDDFARKIAYLDAMGAVCEIVQISTRFKQDVATVASIYFVSGERFDFRWLRLAARQINIHSNWEKRAIISVVEEITGQQFMLVKKILSDCQKLDINLHAEREPKEVLNEWIKHYPSHMKQYEALIDEIKKSPSIEIPMLVVANQQLRTFWDDA